MFLVMSVSNIFIHTNNPGNIRHIASQTWLGSVGSYKGFVSFCDVIYGVRALRILLRNYILSGFDTVDSIISRYAPSNENDTQDYIKTIKRWLFDDGFDANGVIEFDSMVFRSLVQCICKYETGYELTLLEWSYVCNRFA